MSNRDRSIDYYRSIISPLFLHADPSNHRWRVSSDYHHTVRLRRQQERRSSVAGSINTHTHTSSSLHAFKRTSAHGELDRCNQLLPLVFILSSGSLVRRADFSDIIIIMTMAIRAEQEHALTSRIFSYSTAQVRLAMRTLHHNCRTSLACVVIDAGRSFQRARRKITITSTDHASIECASSARATVQRPSMSCLVTKYTSTSDLCPLRPAHLCVIRLSSSSTVIYARP